MQRLEVVDVTEDSVTLQWGAPANADVVSVERYEVTRDVPFGPDEHHFVLETTFTDVGLRGDTEYTYRVKPIGEGGVEGPEVTVEAATLSPATPEPTQPPTASIALQISEGTKALAVTGILGYPEVLDAAISQEGNTLSLTLVVGDTVTEERAKELGDNFVRMVKSLSPDEPPGEFLETGIYDYLVGVYYPGGEQVALGAKVRTSDRITW